MNLSWREQNNTIDQIGLLVKERAGNLFATRQLWCSSAVLVALNQGLGGGLTRDMAIRLTAGLGEGLGGSGCLCGAVSGATLAIGLFLGKGRLSPAGDRTVLAATRKLHDRFRKAFGATCCRALTKDNRRGSREYYRVCTLQTATAAELATELILQQRPKLCQQVDWTYLHRKESQLEAGLKIVASMSKLC